MERSEFCLLGAEGVMENGGIINKVCIMNSYALHVYCIKLYTNAFTILRYIINGPLADVRADPLDVSGGTGLTDML